MARINIIISKQQSISRNCHYAGTFISGTATSSERKKGDQRHTGFKKTGKTLQQMFQKLTIAYNFPQFPVPNVKTNDVAYSLIDHSEIIAAYTDFTGRFPMQSSRGNQYDANCIYEVAVKDRKAVTLTNAWQHLYDLFAKAGVVPKTYVMDNEISNDLKQALENNQTTYQLVPTYSHRRNLAKSKIYTWKNYFKAGLASLNPNFPLSESDRLLNQENITLNLSCASRPNPKLSAYRYIFGEFNFLATPLAPPGTKIVAHVNPANR